MVICTKYGNNDVRSTLVLDQYLVTESLLPYVEECRVINRGDNLSRHSPILLRLRVGEIPHKKKGNIWKPKNEIIHLYFKLASLPCFVVLWNRQNPIGYNCFAGPQPANPA